LGGIPGIAPELGFMQYPARLYTPKFSGGSDEASGGATRAPAPPTAMIYMEPGLSPGYRHEEEEEEEASPGFVDSWLRRCPAVYYC